MIVRSAAGVLLAGLGGARDPRRTPQRRSPESFFPYDILLSRCQGAKRAFCEIANSSARSQRKSLVTRCVVDRSARTRAARRSPRAGRRAIDPHPAFGEQPGSVADDIPIPVAA